MSLRRSIQRVLSILAVLGLLLAPFATPAMAVITDHQQAMSGQEAMQSDMPCCPHEQQKPDCAKKCPLMAICMTQSLQATLFGSSLSFPLRQATLVVLRDDRERDGLLQPPLPRPPNF